MEDNYFDKKLKKILESPPDYPVEPLASQDMLRRLRAENTPKKRRFGLFLLLPLLLLSLLFGAGYFYKKFNALNQQVLDLHQQLDTYTQTIQRDTFINTQVIYQFDTIYHTIYKETYIPAENQNNVDPYNYHSQRVPSLQFSLQRSPFWQDTDLYNSRSPDNSFRLTSLLATTPGSGLFNKNTSANKEVDVLEKHLKNIALLDRYPYSLLENSMWGKFDALFQFDGDAPEASSGKVNPLYYFVPTGFSVSAYASPYVIPTHDFGGSGQLYGITGAIDLPGNRSLEVGAALLNLSFKQEEEKGFANLPLISPNDPTDVLHELKADLYYLQIPVSLRQSIRTKSKFHPEFNIGFVAYQPIRQQFKYELTSSADEYELSSTFNAGLFSIDNIRAGLGVHYEIMEKLSVNTTVNYQHGFSLNQDEYFKLRFLSIALGLRYQLF